MERVIAFVVKIPRHRVDVDLARHLQAVHHGLGYLGALFGVSDRLKTGGHDVDVQAPLIRGQDTAAVFQDLCDLVIFHRDIFDHLAGNLRAPLPVFGAAVGCEAILDRPEGKLDEIILKRLDDGLLPLGGGFKIVLRAGQVERQEFTNY